MSRCLFTFIQLLGILLVLPVEAVAASVTKADFDAIIRKVDAYYQPIAAHHQQTLTIVSDWGNAEPNAHSQQDEGSTNWKTILYGGLARREHMTPDGFTLVVCHEIGHHLAGYPMYVGDWGMINSLSSEGQADYYAAQACVRALWRDDDTVVETTHLPQVVIEKCGAIWKTPADRTLCYRTILAGKAAADTWAASEGTTVTLKGQDPYVAPDINHNYYPSPQCRLDTYVAGALCDVAFKDEIIPGRLHPEGQESEAAWGQAMAQSCREGSGKRPACWFNTVREGYSATLFSR